MATVLLIIQIFIVIALVAVILIQKTGSDGLSGLSGGGHNFLSSRASSDIFSKITMFLAMAFMVNSLALAKIAIMDRKDAKSLIESIATEQTIKVETKQPEGKQESEAPIAK